MKTKLNKGLSHVSHYFKQWWLVINNSKCQVIYWELVDHLEWRHSIHGPLSRYAKLRVAHALGTISPPPLVNEPDVHHGTCVLGSLTHGGGEHVPGIPGARATLKFTYPVRSPCLKKLSNHFIIRIKPRDLFSREEIKGEIVEQIQISRTVSMLGNSTNCGLGPFHSHLLSSITAWISNYIRYKAYRMKFLSIPKLLRLHRGIMRMHK